MRNKSKKATLNELADSLERWGKKHEVIEDPYLNGLINALRTQYGFDFWVDNNPIDLLPVPSASSIKDDRQKINLLNAFRNVLVFVPIAFTWASISQATSAFARYTEKGNARIVNFFDFWENGYGELAPFWKLSNVAFVDFLLLAFIILLSIGISIFENQLEKRERAEQERLESERMTLALEVGQILLPYKKPTVQLINRQVYHSISQLNAVTAKLLAVAKKNKTLHNSTSNLKNISNELKIIKSNIKNIR